MVARWGMVEALGEAQRLAARGGGARHHDETRAGEARREGGGQSLQGGRTDEAVQGRVGT